MGVVGQAVASFCNKIWDGVCWVGTQVVSGFHWVIKKACKYIINLISPNYAKENFQFDTTHTIRSVEIRAVTIPVGSQAFSNYLGIYTLFFTGQKIQHDYVILQVSTKDGLGYYCCQFNNGKSGSYIQIKYFDSYEKADSCGRSSGSNPYGKSRMKDWKRINDSSLSVSRAVQFAKSFDHCYDVADNNCQRFAKGLFDHLGEEWNWWQLFLRNK